MVVLQRPLAAGPGAFDGRASTAAPEVALGRRWSTCEVATASTIVSVQMTWLAFLAYLLWRLVL
jgi:hypothetical protein